jgi:hypothetical protein
MIKKPTFTKFSINQEPSEEFLFQDHFSSAGPAFISKITTDANDKGCWYLKNANHKSTEIFYFKNKKRLAKKCSYQYFIGKIPDVMMIFHTCKDGFCINPNHLYLDSRKNFFKLLKESGWVRPKQIHTPETLAKISKTHKGKTVSQKTKDYLRSLYLGKKRSRADRAKISKGRIGVGVSEEARAKIAFSKQGAKNYNTKLSADMVYEIRSLEGRKTIASTANKFGISNIHVINIWKRKVWKHLN